MLKEGLIETLCVPQEFQYEPANLITTKTQKGKKKTEKSTEQWSSRNLKINQYTNFFKF